EKTFGRETSGTRIADGLSSSVNPQLSRVDKILLTAGRIVSVIEELDPAGGGDLVYAAARSVQNLALQIYGARVHHYRDLPREQEPDGDRAARWIFREHVADEDISQW